jgi:hypothetical protein
LEVVSRSFKSPNAASGWRDPQSGYDIGAKPGLVQVAICRDPASVTGWTFSAPFAASNKAPIARTREQYSEMKSGQMLPFIRVSR